MNIVLNTHLCIYIHNFSNYIIAGDLQLFGQLSITISDNKYIKYLYHFIYHPHCLIVMLHT